MKQIITKLTPLADVFAMLNAIAKPVAQQVVAVSDAAHLVLAGHVKAATRPAGATALIDGWVVVAAEVTGASSYAPVPLGAVPPRVDTGDELPAGTDAVLPVDAIVVRSAAAEAVSGVAPGDGVLAAGSDINAATPLYEAGQRLRASDLAVLSAADISRVDVRVPRITIVGAREDLRLVPAAQFIARDCVLQGAAPQLRNGVDIGDALDVKDVDAVVIVGGTGSGTRDRSVIALARAGHVACHGMGIAPGESAAIGEVSGKPVLIVPGRLDAAAATWLLVGRELLNRLSGCTGKPIASRYRLTRKVASTVGLCELVPVRHSSDGVEPLGGRFFPLSALARATGYLVVPANSEGYAAGAEVAVHNWP